MGNKKEEALRIIAEIRGNLTHKVMYEIDPLIDMLDDLRDLVQDLDECHCNGD